MTRLRLTIACWEYDRTHALRDGTVQPEGIDLNWLVLDPTQSFFRMLRFQEFHVSELSLASYTILKSRGEAPFIAIPIFPSRTFRHSCIYINTEGGIKRPQDLVGKRIGVPEFQMTAAVFMRGLLHHEYGVARESVRWLFGGQEEPGRESVIPFKLPERIKLEPIPPGQTLSRMLEAGEIEALATPYLPSPFLRGSPKVKRLIPNYKEVEKDYYRRTRIFPIMHTLVIREDVYKEHPWVAISLFKAFSRAKEHAYQMLYNTDAIRLTLPWLLDAVEETREALGHDFWPYGLEPNLPTLEALTQYLYEDGLTARKMTPQELFAPNSLERHKM